MSTTHEVNPPKGPLERVLSRLSIKTSQMDREGDGGEPEYTTSDMAAATAGMSDPIGRHLIGVMLEEAPAVNRAVQELDLWGWMRWRVDWPDRQITGALHGRIAAAVLADYQLGGKGYTTTEIRRYLRVSGRRIIQLTPHWHALTRRMHDAESELVEHLRRQLSREAA